MKGTVLVVEDEALVGMELEEGLAQRGLLVPEVVTRGDQVLDAVARVKPDLLLMDIRIAGGLDGIQAAERVRQVSKVPIVFLTAYNDAATVARAQALHPEGFLVKPFSDEELTNLLRNLLG